MGLSVTTFEQIVYEVDHGVAIVTLNRPERLNAWTPQMSSEIFEAMQIASNDDAVKVIIITGSGRGFCAGIDNKNINEISENTSRKREMPIVESGMDGAVRNDFHGLFSYFPAVGKPIIAAINGPLAGSGLVLALACDLRFAAKEAVLSTSFVRLGLTAEHGITWLLNKIIGVTNTHDLLLSARRVSADEAYAMGMFNKVYKGEDLMLEVKKYARDIADHCSPRSIKVVKRQIWESLLEGLHETVEKANKEMILSFSTEDFKEGVASSKEKRKAIFVGR